MKQLTVIIPTFNEASNIQKAIDSVAFADEILVIDSFSTDATVEIAAKKSNVKVIQRVFDNFSNQKNYAIQQATYNWIFLLDADEEVTQELQKEILSTIENPKDFKAFYVYRNFFFKQNKLNFSGWQRDKVIRLFQKNENVYYGKVHEKIQSTGKVSFLKEKLNHYSYKSKNQYQKKLEKYAKLQAEELLEKEACVTPFHIVFKPLARFVIHYFIKLGVLDGVAGFVMSYLGAYGVFMRYKQLIHLKKTGVLNSPNTEKLIIGYDAKRIFHNTTGLGNYGRDLVRILASRNQSIWFYLYNPKPKTVTSLKVEKNIVEQLPKHFIWKKLSSLWRQGPILKQIESDNVKIFHGLTGELPRGIHNSTLKCVVTVHDLIFERYPELYSPIDRKIHFEKVKYATSVANRIIAISEQTKRDIVAFLKVEPNKIDVIYQGCHQVFKDEISLAQQKETLEKYALPEKFILNVGTINERKNLLNLVKALQNTKYNLVVVGAKTDYFKKIEGFLKTDEELKSRMYFLENVPLKDLAALYKMANLFVYPSVFEGFGIPIIEALFSKTPVISSKGSCFKEAGGEHSIYVDVENVQSLKEKINLVLTNGDLSLEMIEKGFEYAQRFNDDLISEKYYTIYKGLL